MLVLTRKTDEIITIGDDIEIMVVAIQGGRVKLGITAPDHLPIQRKERVDTRNDLIREEIERDSDRPFG